MRGRPEDPRPEVGAEAGAELAQQQVRPLLLPDLPRRQGRRRDAVICDCQGVAISDAANQWGSDVHGQTTRRDQGQREGGVLQARHRHDQRCVDGGALGGARLLLRPLRQALLHCPPEWPAVRGDGGQSARADDGVADAAPDHRSQRRGRERAQEAARRPRPGQVPGCLGGGAQVGGHGTGAAPDHRLQRRLHHQGRVPPRPRPDRQGEGGRPRLLKVVLESAAEARAVLAAKRALKGKVEWDSVRIRRSLTAAERAHRSLVFARASQLNESKVSRGEGDSIVYFVRADDESPWVLKKVDGRIDRPWRDPESGSGNARSR